MIFFPQSRCLLNYRAFNGETQSGLAGRLISEEALFPHSSSGNSIMSSQ